MIHRDIKPSNMIITEDGTVKLLDFGLARLVPSPGLHSMDSTESRISDSGTVAGTVAYMSPEQISGKKLDGRSDMFSFGVVLFEMLTCKSPFAGDTIFELASSILHGHIRQVRDLNSRVPPAVASLIHKMLQSDPDNRFRNMREVHDQLKTISMTEVTSTIANRMRSSPWIVYSLMLLLLFLAGWLLIEKFNRDQPMARAPQLTVPVSERRIVVVLPFKNKTGVKGLDRPRLTMTQMVINELLPSRQIRVLPYERLFQIPDLFKDLDKETYDPALLRKVAEYTNSRTFIQPTLFKLGTVWQILLEFKDGATGETTDSRKVIRESTDDPEHVLFEMLPDVTFEIRKQLGSSDMERTKPQPVLSAQGSGEAYMLYNEGVNLLNLGNNLAAVQFLTRSIEKNPNDPVCHATLALAHKSLGNDEMAEANAKRAKELLTDRLSLVDSYFVQASYATAIHDYDTAILLYKKLLEIYPDSPEFHYGLGQIYEDASQYEDAIESYENAVDIDLKYAPAYLRSASLLSYQQKHASARTQADEALKLYMALGNSEGRAKALSTIGRIFQDQNEYDAARKYYSQALEIDRTLQNRSGIAMDLRNSGISYMEQGKLDDGKKALEDASRIYLEMGDRLSTAYMNIEMGNALMRQGESKGALKPYFKALQTAKEINNTRLLADSNDRIGQAYYFAGDFSNGLRYGNLGLSLHKKIKNRKGIIRTSLDLGDANYSLGNFDAAMDLYFQTLKTSEQVKDRRFQGLALGAIGNIHYIRGDYSEALKYRKKELDLFTKIEDEGNAAYTRHGLGKIEAAVGQYDAAVSHLNQAVGYYQHEGHNNAVARVYSALGQVYYFRSKNGDQQQAEKYFQQTLATSKDPIVHLHHAQAYLSRIYANRGNTKQAERACLQAQEGESKGEFHDRCITAMLIAMCNYELGKNKIAKDYALKAIQLGKTINSREALLLSYFYAGQASRKLNDSKQADEFLRQSNAAMNEVLQRLQPDTRATFLSRHDIAVVRPH